MKSACLGWAAPTFTALAFTMAWGCVLLCQGQEPPKPEQPEPVVAKYDEELMIWSLGDQVWEFAELATTYLPAKGEFNPQTREAVWTLQLVRDMTPGEIGFQSKLAGSPFKPTFLNSDKILLVSDERVKFTPITGRLGDAIRVTIRLPEETTLTDVALIRLERRTEIGF